LASLRATWTPWHAVRTASPRPRPSLHLRALFHSRVSRPSPAR
jgi:hypothetical protein